jgi:hypothetical protein
MTTTLQRPANTAPVAEEQATSELAQVDDHSLLTHIRQSSETNDQAAERHRRAQQLAALAHGDREPLEKVRAQLLRRLHRTGSDFDATEGLRTVELALSMTPRPVGDRTWPRREQARSRRWWHRFRRV